VNDRKYILVGLFVLGGLILLGVLIVWFRGASGFLSGGYDVAVHIPSSQGVRGGKAVNQDGLPAGYVVSVASSLPEKPGAWAKLRIYSTIRIPKNAIFIAQQTTVGDIYLDFQNPPDTVYPIPESDFLPTDGSAKLNGILKGPNLLPESIVDDLHSGIAELKKGMQQLEGLTALVANLKELTEPRTLAEVEAGKRKNLWTTLEQFDKTAVSLQTQLNSPDSQMNQLLVEARKAATDLRTTLDKAGKSVDEVNKTLATINEAGKTVKQVGDNSTEFLAKLNNDADHLTAMLDNMNGVITDLRQGKGTLGQLMTNDQLHRELVNLVQNLQSMTDNANRLITMWREQGLLSKEGK
jgi:phospholipid/cholesterol/gamma-HCH transport system substrate-binding protein